MESTASLMLAVAGIVFLVASFLAVLFGVMFSYHWFKFSGNKLVAMTVLAVYTLGCLPILALLLSAVRASL